jgi:sec-independent protein translocase protein TatB
LGLSPVRLLIIVVVALIVLGPDKLPQVAKQAGSLWHSLRSLQQRVEDEIREVAPDLPRSSDLVRYARSPVSLLNQLADKAKAEAAGLRLTGEPEPEPFTMADEPPEVQDPERPPPSWGDPSLN